MGDLDRTIESKADLVADIASGEKSVGRWRIGTEHEKFCFRLDDLKPIPYAGEVSIRAILEGMTEFGWQPKYEGDNLIALSHPNGSSVTLEPAGQFELSGAPLENLHETCSEVHTHLWQVKEVGEKLGIGFLGIGFHPTMTLADAPRMPKARYDIMRRYMPKKGRLGLDMMHRTTTVQVNLDYSDEADMVRKFRVSLALQPIATALFANSPFTESRPNGYRSYRAHIWSDTDPDRTGFLPFVFDEGFGYERWVDYVLDVPMYFVYRDKYIDAAGQSFRDFLDGRLPALPGERPTMRDWADHLTTPFPEVRLKTFLEMRGADGGPWSRLCALPAFWVGLLYDSDSLGAAAEYIQGWQPGEIETLREDVAKSALGAQFRDRKVQQIARDILEISDQGLARRARINNSGDSEQIFLESLWASAESGKSPADDLLDRYFGPWHEDISPVFDYCSY